MVMIDYSSANNDTTHAVLEYNIYSSQPYTSMSRDGLPCHACRIPQVRAEGCISYLIPESRNLLKQHSLLAAVVEFLVPASALYVRWENVAGTLEIFTGLFTSRGRRRDLYSKIVTRSDLYYIRSDRYCTCATAPSNVCSPWQIESTRDCDQYGRESTAVRPSEISALPCRSIQPRALHLPRPQVCGFYPLGSEASFLNTVNPLHVGEPVHGLDEVKRLAE